MAHAALQKVPNVQATNAVVNTATVEALLVTVALDVRLRMALVVLPLRPTEYRKMGLAGKPMDTLAPEVLLALVVSLRFLITTCF
jgi:hypothetical protein